MSDPPQIGFSAGGFPNFPQNQSSDGYQQVYPGQGQGYPNQQSQGYPNQPTQNLGFGGQANQGPYGQLPFVGQQGQQFSGQPGQPAQQYGGQPGQPFGGQPGQQFGGQPIQQYGGQPGQPFGGQPGQPFGGQPGQPFAGQPGQQFGGQPIQQYGGQPSQPFGGQPGQSYRDQTGQGYGISPGNATLSINRPSLHPATNFNAEHDAELLYKAMKGLGTDEKAIIAVLSKRTSAQRKEIAIKFKASYGKSLDKRLRSELSGDFEDVVINSLFDLPTLNAKACYQALKRPGTNEMRLIQVLVPATNAEIQAIKAAYKEEVKSDLEKDIKSDTSGNFQNILVSLLQGCRDEGIQVNQMAASADAEALYKSGEHRLGTEESIFTRILSQRSFVQIKEIAACYLQKYKRTLIKAICKETSGDYETTLVSIVKFAEDRFGLLAEWFHKSVAGFGTRDKDLIRLVLTRAEIDLENIKVAYLRDYKKDLGLVIKKDVSGDYQRMLMALIG